MSLLTFGTFTKMDEWIELVFSMSELVLYVSSFFASKEATNWSNEMQCSFLSIGH